jgi:hypothetical protein
MPDPTRGAQRPARVAMRAYRDGAPVEVDVAPLVVLRGHVDPLLPHLRHRPLDGQHARLARPARRHRYRLRTQQRALVCGNRLRVIQATTRSSCSGWPDRRLGRPSGLDGGDRRPTTESGRRRSPATQRTVLGRTPHGMHPAALLRSLERHHRSRKRHDGTLDGYADDWTPPPRGLLSCAVEVQS